MDDVGAWFPPIEGILIIWKMSTCLNIKKERFDILMLSIKLVCILYLLFSTISCVGKSEDGSSEDRVQFHDLMIILIFLTLEMQLICFKSRICKLCSLVMEPIEITAPDCMQSKIFKDYDRGVALYSKIALSLFFICEPTYIFMSLLFTYDRTNANDKKCSHLAVGWVHGTDDSWYVLILHFVSVIVLTTECMAVFLFFLLMGHSVLKIRLKMRLICAYLDDMNMKIEWPRESFDPNSSRGTSERGEERNAIRTVSRTDYYQGNEAGKRAKNTSYDLVKIQKQVDGNLRRSRIKLHLEKMVKWHCNVMEHVNTSDKTFRLQLMGFFNLGVVTVALGIPKLSLGIKLLSLEHINRAIEVTGIMSLVFLTCYIGQTLLDESDSLRQTLFNCDWTDKPRSLTQGLLIMQTVATRPLRLTVGGIYTLGMETYGNVVSATYKFISLVQSFI